MWRDFRVSVEKAGSDFRGARGRLPVDFAQLYCGRLYSNVLVRYQGPCASKGSRHLEISQTGHSQVVPVFCRIRNRTIVLAQPPDCWEWLS